MVCKFLRTEVKSALLHRRELIGLIKPTNKTIFIIEINIFPKIRIIFLLYLYKPIFLKKKAEP